MDLPRIVTTVDRQDGAEQTYAVNMSCLKQTAAHCSGSIDRVTIKEISTDNDGRSVNARG